MAEVKLKEGTKYDDGKPALQYWSPWALEETARVLAFGAVKYEAWNWAKGIKYTRVFGAMMRHLWAWWRGEQFDEETGLHHLAHAMCCLMFLLHYEKLAESYKEYDDRWQNAGR